MQVALIGRQRTGLCPMIARVATIVFTMLLTSRTHAQTWADVTFAGPTTFSGTVNGIAFTGTYNDFTPFTNTTGTANLFSGQPGTFTPLLPLSDAIGFFSATGFTISFASPIIDPVFHIYSLVDKYHLIPVTFCLLVRYKQGARFEIKIATRVYQYIDCLFD